MPRLVVAVFGLILSLNVSAYSDIRFQHLSLEHGLPQSAVQDMVSDRLGYMWFATQYGLSRYDGYRFRNFRHDPDDPSSLNGSRIQALLVDGQGMLWVGTSSGLNRIDPQSLQIERVEPVWSGRNSPADADLHVRHMVVDRDDNVLVETQGQVFVFRRDVERLEPVALEEHDADLPGGDLVVDARGGVWLYNVDGLWRLRKDRASFRHVARYPVDRRHLQMSSIALMPSGLLAIVSDEGLVLFDPQGEQNVARIQPTDFGHPDNWVGAVAADSRGVLWIQTRRTLVQYDRAGANWQIRFRRAVAERGDRTQYALSLTEDQQGYVWVGLPEGVGVSSPNGDHFELLRHHPDRPGSLSASPWTGLYRLHTDPFGVVWVGGGLGGLSRFSPYSNRFEIVRDRQGVPEFGADNVVRSVLEQRRDGVDYLWVGLGHAGIRVWQRSGQGYARIIDRLHAQAPVDKRIPGGQVWALAEDPRSGHVWAGQTGRVLVLDGDTRKLLAAHPMVRDEREERVKVIRFHPEGRELWVARGSWLQSYTLDESRIRLVPGRATNTALVSPRAKGAEIFNLIRMSSGSILAATSRGIVLWNPQAGAGQRVYPAGAAGEHPRNYVFGLAESPEGTIWLGTKQGGLARATLKADGSVSDWRWYDEDDGLPSATIYAILPEPAGRLWLSSNSGLARFNPETGVFRHFTLADGLQDLEFNHGVARIGQSGRYYFGGINGVNVFRPERIRLDSDPPRIYLQRAELLGASLPVTASQALELELPYDHNQLLFEFAGLHFVSPERNRYAYRLEGIDPDWVEGGNLRTVRYPELPPGQYRFNVRAANHDGIWSEPRELVSVKISAPPWLSPWAYTFYVLAALLMVVVFGLVERRRRGRLEEMVSQRTVELSDQKQLVDRQAAELARVLEARTTLFANISHEFRTPLTLIEAGLDRVIRNPGDSGGAVIARRYLKRLLRLADQLLNLSRLQAVRQRKVPPPWALDRVVDMTVEAFRSLAHERGIHLVSEVERGWLTQCQQPDIERIVMNLLGNALKYCPRGCEVRLRLTAGHGGVLLSVSDDGPGISPGRQAQIFDRFSRLPAHENGRIEGAGIGLTLVREAAQANDGSVELVSTPGQGASFRIRLPAWRGRTGHVVVEPLTGSRLQLELDSLSPESHDRADNPCSQSSDDGPPGDSSTLATALIVEDNEDLRRHLKGVLSEDWNILEAGDGQQALELARGYLPDIVVSDIMMPHMDGLELLRRLRDDVLTSHLPVMLLTARQDDATRLKGYSLSADDFLAKPFRPAELRLRLKRMLDMQKRIQVKLRRELHAGAAVSDSSAAKGSQDLPDLSERDQRLLERVGSWLDANLDNPEASMAALAEFVAVDRRTLQRKLRALTGRTPAAHLQACRLEQACDMLLGSDRSIQDIALSCGFSSPQYFSRVFAQQQGCSPSNWRKKMRQTN